MTSRLLTPGPTPVPEEAAAAMAAPLIHHRTAGFKAMLRETRTRLAAVFRTSGEVAVLTASGTGGMEAAVTSLCRPGGRVLVASCGKFGDRWAEIARAYGLDCVHERCEPGESFAITRFRELLAARGPFDTVFVTGSETSTAVRCDLQSMGEAARETGALVVADTITALAAMPFEMDSWGIDAAVGGSQKAFGVPPGLAFVALGERALARLAEAGLPRFYFDLSKEISKQKNGETAFTPAVPQVAAMLAVLKRLDGDGLAEHIAATARRARAVRAAALAMDLRLLAKDMPSDSVTAIVVPQGIDGASLVRDIESRTGLRLAGGQAELKGKIVRVGHLGFVTEPDTLAAIGALEGALRRAGARIEPGRGVAAALAVFEESAS